eukprot:15457342-Alexandrium_andersonii.AAC.1
MLREKRQRGLACSCRPARRWRRQPNVKKMALGTQISYKNARATHSAGSPGLMPFSLRASR